ncbi:MAG: heavy metal translocating P-type ATPase [Erysipelothrix sp.]
MQNINQSKTQIMIGSLILIILGFISKVIFKSQSGFELFMALAAIMAITPIFIQAAQALKVRVVSIDVLVSIAVIAALVIQNYEEAAIVPFLFLFGDYLEKKTLKKARFAIEELLLMSPKTAFRYFDGNVEEVNIEDVRVGDHLLVKTGSMIPVDGTIIQGNTHVDESSITGESIPLYKDIDSQIFAGTLAIDGTIQMKATQVGEDTVFGKVIEMVMDAQDSKSEVERFIDRFSKYYTPSVLMISLLVGIFTRNLELAVTILVLGCPGALVIGVPVSSVSGIGNAAKHGILVKGSEVFTRLSKADVVIFDKTGTLTTGKPFVDRKKYYIDSVKYREYIATIESQSTHPLAQAIVEEIGSSQPLTNEDTISHAGRGFEGKIDGNRILVGNQNLIESNYKIPDHILDDIRVYQEDGCSIVLASVNDSVVALFGLKDTIRAESKKQIHTLQKLGITKTVILSGDHQRAVTAVQEELGIDESIAELLPNEKSDIVKKYQKSGYNVVFVGDGINDSPSLALADIGIAMGLGSDIAIETADAVLMNSKLETLSHAFGLSKAVKRNMVENIVIALGVVIFLLISLIFSEWMNMALGMLIHEGSILVVILNGMRLLKYDNNKYN